MLDFRLDRHDKNQLELKLTYGLRPNEKLQEYRVETYLFVPRVLSINSHSYGPEQFYQDTATFIRLTAPIVRLSDLSSKRAVKPWAADIKSQIDRFAKGEDGDLDSAEHGLKLLACVFKDAVSGTHLEIRKKIEAAFEASNPSLAAEALADFTEDVESAIARLHKVGERTSKKGVPTRIRESWRAVAEYSSLLAEEALTDLIDLCSDKEEVMAKVLEAARTLAIAQYHRRRELDCSTYAIEGQSNEHLPRRWRVLKRYVSSALYLTVERETSDRVISNLIGMFAAACAMFFATIALLLINANWASELSIAFLAAMVASYVIKDRIKELGKRNLGRRLKHLLPDHKVRILGLYGAKIGSAKETFHIRQPDSIPSEIAAWRISDLDSHEAVTGRPETVLCYQKDIQLSSTLLRNQFAGAQGLVDVVRLNMRPMMARMTDAWETYRYVHPTTHEVKSTRCARVYHINIVIRLVDGEGRNSIHRVRVVVNKKGIVRVENVEPKAEDRHIALGETTDSPNINIFDD